MRRAIFVPTLLAMMVLLGGRAVAGPEWCDAGSPPPNDFRLRPTGTGSATSSLSWLKSTTGGTLDLAAGVNTLQGGVATGMNTALGHAPSYSDLGTADRDHDEDGDRDGDHDDDDHDDDDHDDDD